MATRPTIGAGRRLLLHGMLAGAASFWLAAAVPQAEAQEFTPSEETPEQYPDGPGREQTFYSCTPCHGFRIVAQQRQSRPQWDDTLDFMTTRFGMPKLEGNDRAAVLDYLATAFPARTTPGGWRNPFSK